MKTLSFVVYSKHLGQITDIIHHTFSFGKFKCNILALQIYMYVSTLFRSQMFTDFLQILTFFSNSLDKFLVQKNININPYSVGGGVGVKALQNVVFYPLKEYLKYTSNIVEKKFEPILVILQLIRFYKIYKYTSYVFRLKQYTAL